jgi:hypothetical protein
VQTLLPKLDLEPDGEDAKQTVEPQLLARTGGFLCADKHGVPNYLTDKCANPHQLGGIRIRINLRRNKERGLYAELGYET